MKPGSTTIKISRSTAIETHLPPNRQQTDSRVHGRKREWNGAPTKPDRNRASSPPGSCSYQGRSTSLATFSEVPITSHRVVCSIRINIGLSGVSPEEFAQRNSEFGVPSFVAGFKTPSSEKTVGQRLTPSTTPSRKRSPPHEFGGTRATNRDAVSASHGDLPSRTSGTSLTAHASVFPELRIRNSKAGYGLREHATICLIPLLVNRLTPTREIDSLPWYVQRRHCFHKPLFFNHF